MHILRLPTNYTTNSTHSSGVLKHISSAELLPMSRQCIIYLQSLVYMYLYIFRNNVILTSKFKGFISLYVLQNFS